MDRAGLVALLEDHARRWPEDAGPRRADPCVRRCARGLLPAHVPAGASDGVGVDTCPRITASVLLVHHRKLGRWLQPGGHADGEADLFRVALREAREETGLVTFKTLPGGDPPAPLDLDIHEIPPHGGEPAHLHLDVRFLLVAAPGEVPRASEESAAVRWVPRERLGETSDEESLRRMERRGREVLARIAAR